jgi:hypothetical protein
MTPERRTCTPGVVAYLIGWQLEYLRDPIESRRCYLLVNAIFFGAPPRAAGRRSDADLLLVRDYH